MISISFIVPFLFFSLSKAVIVSIVWGALLLTVFNYILAKMRKVNPVKAIAEHMVVAGVVVVIAYYLGIGVAKYLG